MTCTLLVKTKNLVSERWFGTKERRSRIKKAAAFSNEVVLRYAFIIEFHLVDHANTPLKAAQFLD